MSSRSKDRTPEEILAVDMDSHLMVIELLEPVIEGPYCDVEHFFLKGRVPRTDRKCQSTAWIGLDHVTTQYRVHVALLYADYRDQR